MTLFSNTLPFNCLLRVYDVMLNEHTKIFYRVALAILKIKEKTLLNLNGLEDIMNCLKTFNEPEFKDEDLFMKIVFKLKIKRS